MTTTRTSTSRRTLPFLRRAAVALLAGAGMALTIAPAHASTPGGGGAAVAAPAHVAAPNARAQKAVNTALAQVGDRYVWGGAGPNTFDCSGLTMYAYKAAGIALPHSSRLQATKGKAVSRAALKPGDLLFFYSPISHVGMYIGGGKMVHASTYGQPVKVVNLGNMPGLVAARRIA